MSLFMENDPVLFPHAQQGVVEDPISPNQFGYIKFQGSYWKASLYQKDGLSMLPTGSIVKVLGRNGIVLLVEPY